ncbi:oxidoreductase [Sphingomonas sp. PAMC 26605]|uniref:oxidoreductase n=1 Tax=Sphingomonas sp. PAMC 26605 TaxID=1112214 RepID=UPI00055CD974|nr:oxidoreductase [Sphingomonas sp. PAMC 26605]
MVLVTGASSGIGKDIAHRLLVEGYDVFAGARRVDRMSDLAGAGAVVIGLDVTDDASMVTAVERIIEARGHIDVLVNAAGYGQYGALEDVSLDDGRRQMETNLMGPARLIQLCLPTMRAQRRGWILNISSIGGKLAMPLGGWYHASKFALEGYSDTLRNEVRQFDIDVVVIEPGGIQSEWGNIAATAAAQASGQGAYARMVDKFAKTQNLKTPPPSVVSDMVMKALRAKRPATRYSGGLGARPLLILRKVLSDRMLDRLTMLAFR